ncbi:MAG: ABC transporter ATP-binding protein, partial [Pseudomonadales bacterium]|nr:ABC transporter ATP-binding protein [Pseudomonadales bacterium]
MSNTVVSAENLAKVYRLGPTISGDLRETLTDQIKRLGRRRTYTGKRDGSNEHWALRDVGFEVVEGEVFGIIGRNGAGKSTLLKILSRVSPPTRGHARMVGRVGALLEVGTGFHPELNGRENTYLNGAILGMTRREIDRVYDSIVEYAGIQEFMEMPVKRYSSGMRVRLGFAIAAHLRPEILILDEVLAVGDVEFQRKSSRTILDYTRGGHTVLFVSHNMEAVRTICSRTLVLDKGQVTFVGPTDQAIEYYQESLRPADGTNLLKVRRDNPSLTPLIANV